MNTITLDLEATTAAATPDLLEALRPPSEAFGMGLSSRYFLALHADASTGTRLPFPAEGEPMPPHEPERADRIKRLMAWAADPHGMDWDLIERNEDYWDKPDDS